MKNNLSNPLPDRPPRRGLLMIGYSMLALFAFLAWKSVPFVGLASSMQNARYALIVGTPYLAITILFLIRVHRSHPPLR